MPFPSIDIVIGDVTNKVECNSLNPTLNYP
jgi:hypothetical protein